MRTRDTRVHLNGDEISVSRVVHVSWQLAASDAVVKELMSLNDINFKAALISSFCRRSVSLSFFLKDSNYADPLIKLCHSEFFFSPSVFVDLNLHCMNVGCVCGVCVI